MAKKMDTDTIEQKTESVEGTVEVQTQNEPTANEVKIGRYSKFEDIPENDKEVLFNTIVDYSNQAISRSIQRDTAIFLIYDKFKELLG